MMALKERQSKAHFPGVVNDKLREDLVGVVDDELTECASFLAIPEHRVKGTTAPALLL
eukprot:CAMPEP_0171153436 /NCGR_PEP_ID=MMETSP0766_2-20121228/151069_1 /TAXON_ID=439317 /ORGANISM="Gambierdiscus australes, Strain CAWD 149" /LENGTH=57 /DNA_ID=CAMNT_0011617353 /DNA_START=99 /DNA_END=273 /DNA_ORIENTATION=+